MTTEIETKLDLNDDIDDNIPWDIHNTQKSYNFITSSSKLCANSACNQNSPFILYKGSKRTSKSHGNSRKGHIIDNNLRRKIFYAHNVIIGPNYQFCNSCKTEANNNINNIRFKTVSKQMPSFNQLDIILNTDKKIKNNINDNNNNDNKNISNNKSLLNMKKLNVKQMEISFGLSEENLMKILKKT